MVKLLYFPRYLVSVNINNTEDVEDILRAIVSEPSENDESMNNNESMADTIVERCNVTIVSNMEDSKSETVKKLQDELEKSLKQLRELEQKNNKLSVKAAKLESENAVLKIELDFKKKKMKKYETAIISAGMYDKE